MLITLMTIDSRAAGIRSNCRNVSLPGNALFISRGAKIPI